MQRLVLSIFFIVQQIVVLSQQNTVESKEQWLNSLDSLLTLTESQEIALEGIFLSYELEKSSIDLSLIELQHEPLDPMEWEIKDNALRKRRKSIAQEREEKILAVLTVAQQNIYIEKIAPSKPQVLHMGIKHDKINCNVCLKPSNP